MKSLPEYFCQAQVPIPIELGLTQQSHVIKNFILAQVKDENLQCLGQKTNILEGGRQLRP